MGLPFLLALRLETPLIIPCRSEYVCKPTGGKVSCPTFEMQVSDITTPYYRKYKWRIVLSPKYITIKHSFRAYFVLDSAASMYTLQGLLHAVTIQGTASNLKLQ